MKLNVKKGRTSKTIPVYAVNSATGVAMTGLTYGSGGLVFAYRRETAGDVNPVVVTLATMTRGTWVAGGFAEIGAVTMPGFYELGLPDEMIAGTAKWVAAVLRGATNMLDIPMEIQLTDGDFTDTQTESYAADGAEASINQLLYQNRSINEDLVRVGLTLTAYKLDGAATAMVISLDSGTDPTVMHRTA